MGRLANGSVCHDFAIRFDTARTLTYVRTDGLTDDYQDPADEASVLNPSGGVEDAGPTIREALDALIGWQPSKPAVLNHEPRKHIPGSVRRALAHRDGDGCWICGQRGADVVDHVHPRSSFEPEYVRVADSTYNLRLACFDCNASKSNQWWPGASHRDPIAWRCPNCWLVEHDDSDRGPDRPIFCDHCRATTMAPYFWAFRHGPDGGVRQKERR